MALCKGQQLEGIKPSYTRLQQEITHLQSSVEEKNTELNKLREQIQFSQSDLQDKIQTYLLEKVTESWYLYFGLLERYYAEFKTSRVPKRSVYKVLTLGRWVATQRSNYKKGKLSKERIELLESIGFEWY